MKIRITIPLALPSRNATRAWDRARSFWRFKKLASDYRLHILAALPGPLCDYKATATTRRRVTITAVRPRRLDRGNYDAKLLEDVLTAKNGGLGILFDDDDAHCELMPITTATGKAETVITIEDLEA